MTSFHEQRAHETPSRPERFFWALAYLATSLIGISVILDPPPLVDALGQELTFIWALAILTALPCVISAYKARYRLEYTLLPVFTTALIVSVIALWIHFGHGEIAYTLPRVLSATALVLVFTARFWSLHRIVTTTAGESPTWIQRLYRRSRR